MLLATLYDSVELHRQDKILYARFLVPHRVLSTCRVAGGLREDIDFLYNHQSCEPAGGHCGHATLAIKDPLAYRDAICSRHDLPSQGCATLGTAANMRNAAIVEANFRDLQVVAVCTGGVEGNAGRVGDPASVVETENGFERLPQAEAPPPAGTINTMLFISKPLISGAMVRAVMTATEAKTAALQELAVGSRYSNGLATGTGTDQIAVAAVATSEGGDKALTSAGKHAKLGELIGQAVNEAIKGTLALQNGLTTASQCSVEAHLRRFGMDAEGLRRGVCRFLREQEQFLFSANFLALERDPLTVAAVAALVHLKDKTAWGTLPQGCWLETASNFAAQVAAAVSGSYEDLALYRRQLASQAAPEDTATFLHLICQAIALGFQHKWPELVAEETASLQPSCQETI
ncbi:MAG: adenosylcobinamide amidohydrolase [Desulfobulbaceae bacterium]|nr:adenosylcobinamide amidohydrolase [Desulfobulbaceae bacterium]